MTNGRIQPLLDFLLELLLKEPTGIAGTYRNNKTHDPMDSLSSLLDAKQTIPTCFEQRAGQEGPLQLRLRVETPRARCAYHRLRISNKLVWREGTIGSFVRLQIGEGLHVNLTMSLTFNKGRVGINLPSSIKLFFSKNRQDRYPC